MDLRRVLVIGSQCDQLNKLLFLPDLAESLRKVLMHPGPGEYAGVPLDSGPAGLLIDPTVEVAKAVMQRAIADAGRDGATLLLAYIGHGQFQDPNLQSGDFFLMPKDATKQPTLSTAIRFASFIEDAIYDLDRINLFVLLDTCYSGVGAWQAMQKWVGSLKKNISFVLLAPTDDRSTADAPLSRAVIELSGVGTPEIGRAATRAGRPRLAPRSQSSGPVHRVQRGERPALPRAEPRADPGDVFWKDRAGEAQILKNTWYFQPTPQLDAVVPKAGRTPWLW